MNELKEIFDMVTKQTEPDLDSWKDQEDRQRRRQRNRRLGAYAVAAAIVVVAAVAIAALREGRGDQAEPAVPPSVAPGGGPAITHSFLDTLNGERTPVPVEMVGGRALTVSPDGQAIAYNTCCTSRHALYVAGLDGSDRVTITPDDLNGYAATWIDDDSILFQARDAGTKELGDLYVANISTGEMHMVTDLPDERNGAWIVMSDLSPDGTTVLFHLPRGKGYDATWDLWTAPLAGGEATLLREDAGFAAYAPDGRIVFLDHPVPFESDAIWIMDGDGRNARSLVEGGVFTWPRVSPDGTMVAYGNGGKAEIVHIASGDITAFDDPSEEPAWYGNGTLIVD